MVAIYIKKLQLDQTNKVTNTNINKAAKNNTDK
jgi:hypothetical protein